MWGFFFLFISAAGSLFNGSWNGAYIYTPYSNIPRWNIRIRPTYHIYIYVCKSNAYQSIVYIYVYCSSFWLKFKAFIAMSENVDVGIYVLYYVYIYDTGVSRAAVCGNPTVHINPIAFNKVLSTVVYLTPRTIGRLLV